MAITINGTGSITGLTAGGLPDGSVVAADLASSLDLTGKTVTLPSGTGGKILQITEGTQSTQMSTTLQTFQDTNLSASITPSASDSKVLVLITQPTSFSIASNAAQGAVRLVRGSTSIWEPGNSAALQSYANGASTVSIKWHWSLMYLDSPSTTSATTYKTQIRTYSSSITGYAQNDNSPSYMYLVEVAA